MSLRTYSTIALSHHLLPAPWPAQTVTTITLNRPHVLNAFDLQMCADLVSAFSDLSSDDKVRAIVLTGAGTRAFCAGADLKPSKPSAILTSNGGTPEQHRDEGGQVSLAIHRCTKPVIAAIAGAAVGIGITMTLPCTIRITHNDSKISFPFVRRGLVPEACSSWFLPRLIGHSRAIHVLSTGETLPGGSRLLDGLFSEVLEKREDVLPRAYKLAQMIATQTSAVSGYLVKEMLWRGLSTPEETHLLESRLLAELFTSNDHAEGVKAFLEKREPVFTGSIAGDCPPAVPWWTKKAKL